MSSSYQLQDLLIPFNLLLSKDNPTIRKSISLTSADSFNGSAIHSKLYSNIFVFSAFQMLLLNHTALFQAKLCCAYILTFELIGTKIRISVGHILLNRPYCQMVRIYTAAMRSDLRALTKVSEWGLARRAVGAIFKEVIRHLMSIATASFFCVVRLKPTVSIPMLASIP